jgi:MoaA/NifB/PqqE/SkfB family radical SAM enzyme
MNIFSTGANKLFFFPERVEEWRSGEMISPICLEIQPTELCNHRCPQCQGKIGRSLRDRREFKNELDLELLNSVWDNPPLGIVISGDTGDPLLYSKLGVLLSRVEALSIPTALISNGEALTQDIAHQIVSACRGVRISLDAFDPDS